MSSSKANVMLFSFSLASENTKNLKKKKRNGEPQWSVVLKKKDWMSWMNEKKTEGLFLLRVKMLSRGSFSKYTNRMCFNKCTSNTFVFSHMILMMKFFIPPIYSLHFTLGTETFPHFFLNIQCVGPQRSCSDKKLIICYSHSYITHISSIFFCKCDWNVHVFFSYNLSGKYPNSSFSHYFANDYSYRSEWEARLFYK